MTNDPKRAQGVEMADEAEQDWKKAREAVRARDPRAIANSHGDGSWSVLSFSLKEVIGLGRNEPSVWLDAFRRLSAVPAPQKCPECGNLPPLCNGGEMPECDLTPLPISVVVSYPPVWVEQSDWDSDADLVYAALCGSVLELNAVPEDQSGPAVKAAYRRAITELAHKFANLTQTEPSVSAGEVDLDELLKGEATPCAPFITQADRDTTAAFGIDPSQADYHAELRTQAYRRLYRSALDAPKSREAQDSPTRHGHCPACANGEDAEAGEGTHLEGTFEHPSSVPQAGVGAGAAVELPPLDVSYDDRKTSHFYNLSPVVPGESDRIKSAEECCRERQLLAALSELAKRDEEIAELESQRDGAGDVLGRVCVLGTLTAGEKPVLDDEVSKHAAVRAIVRQIERAMVAEARLAALDGGAKGFDAKEFAAKIVNDIAELPDRNSPDDWPEAMLVTGEELISLITDELASHSEAPPAVDREEVEELLRLAEAARKEFPDIGNTTVEDFTDSDGWDEVAAEFFAYANTKRITRLCRALLGSMESDGPTPNTAEETR